MNTSALPALRHVPEYNLRVDDQLGFVFRLNGKPTATPYRLNVGDVVRIGSETVTTLSYDSLIQPDGTIVLPQVGSVIAAGKSIESLRTELDQRFGKILKNPAITVVPVTVNRNVTELIAAINNRSGIFAGQAFLSRVSPDGTVQLPAIGAVPVQGLSLAELRNEIESRYAELVQGVDITPVLRDRAPRSVYVLGECKGRQFPFKRTHHRHSGDRVGGELEHRRQSQASDCLPPRFGLAADGHSRQRPAGSV